MEPGVSMPHSKGLSNNPYLEPNQSNFISFFSSFNFMNEDYFYNVRLLASRQTPKLKNNSWSDVHDCLFNIFAANLHIWRPTPPSATQGTRHAGLHNDELHNFSR